MKEQLNAIMEYVKNNKKDVAIGLLTGFSMGITYKYISYINKSNNAMDTMNVIIKAQSTMLKNDKIMIDTQTEFIKFLQK